MKFNKFIAVLFAALFVAASGAKAQTTNSFTAGLNEMANAISSTTNWTVVTGYGRATSGNKNIAFADVAFAFNQNIGAVVGYDDLFGAGKPQLNAVKGGITLSATIHPFAFVGSTFLTNIVGTPFVADLIATPHDSSSSVGNIIDTGYNFNIASVKNFEIVGGVSYEVRSGEGDWDGNYILAHIGLTRSF